MRRLNLRTGRSRLIVRRLDTPDGFAADGFGGLLAAGWVKPLAFVAIAPTVRLIVGLLTMTALYWIFRNTTPVRVDR